LCCHSVPILRAQGHRDSPGAYPVHVLKQAADEVGDHVGAQCPTGTEVAEYPRQVGQAREHHAAVGDRVCEQERLTVDHEFNVAEYIDIEAGRRNDDVGL
jgi:hypothetical protein